MQMTRAQGRRRDSHDASANDGKEINTWRAGKKQSSSAHKHQQTYHRWGEREAK
jgi:hypothetical protein